MLRQMLRRINNYIFPDETPLTFVYPRWWWNRMRSSCWNAPAVSVLLGLIAGVCWAPHGHTGLASDPKQLLSRQGLQLRMPNPSPCSSPGRHIWKTLLWPLRGSWPCSKCILAYLVSKSTCLLTESFPSELFSANRHSFVFAAELCWIFWWVLKDFYTPQTPSKKHRCWFSIWFPQTWCIDTE